MKAFPKIPIPLLFVAIILTTSSMLPQPAVTAPLPGAKTENYLTDLNFSDGIQTGYELHQVRWGDHRTFERVVLEFSGGSDIQAGALPQMEISTEKYPVRVTIRLPGAPYRSDSIFTSPDPFAKSRMLSRLNIFDLCGGNQFLALIPARPLEYDVFALENPARLVIDLRLRVGIPSEQEKYSLRTLPLFGDQPCTFMDAARASDFNPRLLTDNAGNVFGELNLYSSPDHAFREKEKLKKLSEHFSLVIKARGVMETPATVP